MDGRRSGARPGNVAELLWRGARTHPQRPCVTDLDAPGGPRTLTYAQLTGRVADLAGGLTAAGIAPGDRVALLLHNSTEFVETFLAVAAAGAVAVPLNVRLREPDFRHMLSDSGAALLVTESALLDRVPSGGDLRIALADRERPDRAGRPLAEPVDRAADDLLSLMYTSGTTGAPKAVMLTHRSWHTVADMAQEVLGFRGDDVVLHVAPLTHGAGFLLLPTLAAGGNNLLCRSYDAARTAALLHTARVTGIFLVPSMIRMLLDALPDGWAVPDGFRWLYYAGSPIQPDTLRAATTAFAGRLVQSFGQMEAPMFLTALAAADHARAVREPGWSGTRSAGRVLAGVELAIVDAAGAPVPAGVSGEVLARAPQTMAGYWGRPEATADTLVGGWLHTGDVGYLDAEGYLFVVDRLKDMIITGGANVYAREVEEVLLTLPGVRDAAVIGTPDRVWGEAVTAVLVAGDGGRDGEAVRAACRERLAGYRVPKHVHWVEELPRNAYGKVLKRELRRALHPQQ
ncbi:AMP-dependent synthetase [Pseudonocardia asaccharolytica DSM 44247 = NBRC 16224]|uniref:AMP-dependent synthetase n=2 Tax=Pseudonocardia asaccharolytica TaxID=54010 RepID=A0A511D5G2_9PSEU|nr:AMP-dependent synthetase [Pseudonocardia asaccharolytica DSM 44247 = NBRC 16224]